MFKVKLIFSDGDTEELDGVFDAEAEAEEYALESISEYHLERYAHLDVYNIILVCSWKQVNINNNKHQFTA